MLDGKSQEIAILLGLVIPFLTALIRSHKAASWVASVIAVTLCLLGALLALALGGAFDGPKDTATFWAGVGDVIWKIILTTVAMYNLVVKPTGAADRLEKMGGIALGTQPTPEVDTSYKPPVA